MPKPFLLCIGHRGAMGHEPENTLRSIEKAMTLGAPCVEVDVHLVESQLVVIHDDSLERTTNGSGLLSQISLAELRVLDAGCGERIPTLAEVCALVHPSTCLNIELKGAGTAAPVVAQIEFLVASGWQYDALLVSSFDHHQLSAVGALNDQILLGYLLDEQMMRTADKFDDIRAFSVHARHDLIDASFVTKHHRRGLRVFAYTANDQAEIARMEEYGVDGVFTNFPENVLSEYDQGVGSTSWVARTRGH